MIDKQTATKIYAMVTARREGDFGKSDEIRDELINKGYSFRYLDKEKRLLVNHRNSNVTTIVSTNE